MDMHSSRSNKRQRIDSTPVSLSQLPANVLSNCFSFLGSSGHYYFLASVCKDFKVAVDELYGDDRNTSMDSILTSVSTCTHVMNLSDAVSPDGASVSSKILTAVFENDRLDLYQGVLLEKYPNRSLQDDLNTMIFMTSAIRYKSTEIMRSIIANEQIIYLLKNAQPPEGMEIETTPEDMESIVQSIPAACDSDMIHQLVEKGVVFKNGISIFFSLRRKDLETFECLLDILKHEELRMEQKVILQALEHEMHLDAIKLLKQKGYFDKDEILSQSLSYVLRTPTLGINVFKAILEDRRNIDDGWLKNIIAFCIIYECMDELSYIHESIQRINIDFWIQFAVNQNFREVIPHLQSMR